ncbi:SARP family transcriptional regulator [Deinococcus sp. YIM 134068]|uniref:SARP family transcriptional regulator n=1 Tax=Deinococcus lichenicola TaxID=3118910 RepID=UPI003FA4783C
MGRFDEAIEQFQQIEPLLSDELSLRNQRWWGTTEFQMGQVEFGLMRCEKAWHGYIALGDEELTGRITQTLGQMYTVIGNDRRALQLYKEALKVLQVDPVPYPRITALHSAATLYLEFRDLDGAEIYIKEARAILARPEYVADQWLTLILTVEADLYRLRGDQHRLHSTLLHLLELVQRSGDHEVRIWTASRLAEFYSEQGQHAKAMDALHKGAGPGQDLPPPLLVTRAVVMRRRGQVELALSDFEAALPSVRAMQDAHLLTRTLLHQADALRRAGRAEEAVDSLREALERLLQDRDQGRYKPDIEELSELTHSALLEPEVAPFMEAVLEKLSAVAGGTLLDDERLSHVQVQTLGRVRVTRDGQPVPFELHGSALLLVYLKLYPGRTRQEIQLDLYPDKEPTAGSNYIRSAIRELREGLGRESVVHSGPHNQPRYSLGSGLSLTLDVEDLRRAVGEDDAARILALYRGPFMPPVTDSEWADQLRDELQTAVTLALRGQMRAAQGRGDLRRALLLANQYLRVDPYDPEVLEERVEIARRVASPQEVARYVVELQRMGG